MSAAWCCAQEKSCPIIPSPRWRPSWKPADLISKANLKSVTVIRREGSNMKNYIVNLKLALDGKENQPFFLKPSDIIVVPERFAMF